MQSYCGLVIWATNRVGDRADRPNPTLNPNVVTAVIAMGRYRDR